MNEDSCLEMPHLIQSQSGPETLIDDVRYLYFGGTSYLGLQTRPEVIEAGCSALREFGLHTGTSRAGFGTSRPLLEVESQAAAFFGTDAAFYFSSGYVSNHIMVSALAKDIDTVIVDDGSHFCVQEAAMMSGKEVVTFAHRDPEDLARVVDGRGRVLIMADAVGPSAGTVAPVMSYLSVLSRCAGATLLLDDAHGFGVLGRNGRGLVDSLGLWQHVNGGDPADGVRLCVCGTLAKALGGFGGIIPGTTEFIERVRTASHYFDGASPQPPAVTAAAARALQIVMAEPELRAKLRANTLRLRDGLRAMDLEVPDTETAHFGVTLANADRMRSVHLDLKSRGILVPYVPAYSGIPAEGVLRIAVFATHSSEQIDQLLDVLREIL